MTCRYSIVTPVYDPPADVLRDMIDSVLAQTLTDWELILVDDSSPSPHVVETLRSYAGLDARIVVIERQENGGIVAASNDGLDVARGDFVGLLDHDDTLVPEALRLVEMYAAKHPEMDYCYSDEDLLSPNGHYIGPFYKPEWSPERLRGQNYCTHFSVFRSSLLDEIGGFREGFDGSQDYDIILRATEAAREIVHIPFVLYHWRQLATSVATGDPAVKPYAYEAGRRAVQDHCDRIGIEAVVELGPWPGNYRVRRRIAGDPLTSVVIATDGRSGRVWGVEQCHVVNTVRSVAASTSRPIEFVIVASPDTPPEARAAIARAAGDTPLTVIDGERPAGVSEMINLGVASSAGEFVLLLHDAVDVISDEFLDEMLGLAAADGVGAVGAKTSYADGRIRDAGYVFNGNPHRIMHGRAADEPGHRGLLTVTREVAGLSRACMLLRRSVFFDIGGMSTTLEADYCDVDLSLKLRRERLSRIWTPYAELYDFSPPPPDPAAASRDREAIGRRWGHQLKDDPYYNPNLEPDRDDWLERGLR